MKTQTSITTVDSHKLDKSERNQLARLGYIRGQSTESNSFAGKAFINCFNPGFGVRKVYRERGWLR